METFCSGIWDDRRHDVPGAGKLSWVQLFPALRHRRLNKILMETHAGGNRRHPGGVALFLWQHMIRTVQTNRSYFRAKSSLRSYGHKCKHTTAAAGGMYTVASRSLPQCYRGLAYGSYGVVTVIWKPGFIWEQKRSGGGRRGVLYKIDSGDRLNF